MGISWSNPNPNLNPHRPRLPPQQPYLNTDPTPLALMPPPSPPQPNYNPYLPPPPQQQQYYPQHQHPYYYPQQQQQQQLQQHQHQYNFHNTCAYTASGSGSGVPGPYYNNYGWQGQGNVHGQGVRVPVVPQYVSSQEATKIKNEVNVHKDTISLHVDEKNPGDYLVSFTFDALSSGSITIFYFGKEGENCKFSPLYPEAHMPVRITFQEGLGQKFYQPSGTGIDLGFFELDDLSKPSASEDVFPLVIYVEAGLPPLSSDELFIGQCTPSQSTQAVLVLNCDGSFQAKVIRQILWIDGVRYELRDLYGISNSNETGFNDDDPGKDCVICMSEPKDTAVLPCRHMCICSECAKELRLQTNKCPICRQPIEELMEIKVSKGDDQ